MSENNNSPPPLNPVNNLSYGPYCLPTIGKRLSDISKTSNEKKLNELKKWLFDILIEKEDLMKECANKGLISIRIDGSTLSRELAKNYDESWKTYMNCEYIIADCKIIMAYSSKNGSVSLYTASFYQPTSVDDIELRVIW